MIEKKTINSPRNAVLRNNIATMTQWYKWVTYMVKSMQTPDAIEEKIILAYES